MFEKILEWIKMIDFWIINDKECEYVRLYSIRLYKDNYPLICELIDEETGKPMNNYNRREIATKNVYLTKADAVAELARREEKRHQKRMSKLANELKPKPESEESNANSSE